MFFLTSDIEPCPGTLKAASEDFRVEEIPAYAFSGEGDHTLVRIEKSGISTFEAIRRLCRELSFPERDVGYAGLKDTIGVTTQWLSFEHCPPERFATLEIPKLRILEITRHANKLKRGHLKGNRFEITLRDVRPEDEPRARHVLGALARKGVPNWYDEQRFGRRGANAELGLALLKRDFPAYFKTLLGSPHPDDTREREARKAYDDGKLDEALNAWPQRDNLERSALKAVIEHGPGAKALHRLPQKIKLLHVSAAQSLLFNRCLERRFFELSSLWQGDLCEKDNGAVFEVLDPALEQPRADALEVHPTGPVFGHKMIWPKGRELEIEREVLEQAGLKPEDFELGMGLSQKGDRRAYRFRLGQFGGSYDVVESRLTVRFSLPKGCYATVVMKEITKDEGVDLTFEN